VENAGRIRWGRVVAGGLLAEVGILIVVLPFAFTETPERFLVYVVPPVSLVMTFIFGRWTGTRVDSRFLLHGALAGLVAAVVYIAVVWGQTLPPSYTLAHFLKVIGGAAGGYVAGKSKRAIDRVADAHVS
jgi:putative membrane protein (TIGR04086 family)